MAHLDHPANERGVCLVASEAVDESCVDLELVEREDAERGEGRGASAVVEGEADADVRQPADDGPVELRAGARPGRHDLEHEVLRIGPRRAQEPDDAVGELWVVEEPVGDVDGYAE